MQGSSLKTMLAEFSDKDLVMVTRAIFTWH